MAAAFDTTWDFAALSNAVCDTLVDQGKIRAKPAFIRGDRQTKIAEVCLPPSIASPLPPHPFPHSSRRPTHALPRASTLAQQYQCNARPMNMMTGAAPDQIIEGHPDMLTRAVLFFAVTILI